MENNIFISTLENVDDFLKKNWEKYNQYTLLNVYLVGSRLYGTESESSDYDYVIIVNGDYFPGPILIEVGVVNANIFHLDYWKRLLMDNVVWMLKLVWIPKKNILLETERYEPDIRKINLNKMILMDSFHNYNKAKRWWAEDKHIAKKNVIHGLRWLNFGFQILEHGKIIDFQSVNSELYWLLAQTDITWDEIEKKYRPIYTDLCQSLTNQCKPILVPSNKKQSPLWIIDYIKTFGLSSLSKELSISYQRHNLYPNLILFSLDPLNSPDESLVVQECSGLILDESDDWRIISQGYNMFFSHDDFKKVTSINWKKARVFEKAEGSLAILYYYKQWQVASILTPDGSEEIRSIITGEKFFYDPRRPVYNAWRFFGDDIVKDHRSSPFLVNNEDSYYPHFPSHIKNCDVIKIRFSDLFWKIWQEKKYQLPEDKSCCYLFELCSEKLRLIIARGRLHECFNENPNQVATSILQPTYDDLLLCHGIRNTLSGKELSFQPIASQYGWECVEEFSTNPWKLENFYSVKSLFQYARYLNPLVCKGFVVVDEKFNRMKIKSPQYIAIKKLCWSSENENTVSKLIMQIILSNNTCDFLQKFKQYSNIYQEVLSRYSKMVDRIFEEYIKVEFIEDIEEFKKLVANIPFHATLFNFRNKKVHTKEDARKLFCEIPFKIFENILKIIESTYN